MNRLLLIDDEEDVLYSFTRHFSPPEIELTTASSGEEGVRRVPEFKPDLVIYGYPHGRHERPGDAPPHPPDRRPSCSSS